MQGIPFTRSATFIRDNAGGFVWTMFTSTRDDFPEGNNWVGCSRSDQAYVADGAEVRSMRSSPRRTFSPCFVAALGSCYVFVDHLQPVAVSVSLDGEVIHVHSWANSVAPPAELAWPNRQLWRGSTALCVQDLPNGEIVELTADASCNLSHRVIDGGVGPSGAKFSADCGWLRGVAS